VSVQEKGSRMGGSKEREGGGEQRSRRAGSREERERRRECGRKGERRRMGVALPHDFYPPRTHAMGPIHHS
jgi:hypothetical protein